MDKQTAGLAGHADTGSEGDGLLPEDIAALFDTSSQWIWETDAELRFSRLPENYEAITGIAPGKVLGRFRFDFLQQASKGSRAAAAHLEDLEARRPFRDFIYELKGGRDDCRWVSTTGFPRFDAEGAFVGYRGIARNVTAMASQLDALKATRSGLGAGEDILAGESHAERMMAALNIMSDAFCYYDRNDKLILYNEAMLDLQGWPTRFAPASPTDICSMPVSSGSSGTWTEQIRRSGGGRRWSDAKCRIGRVRSGLPTAAGSCIARCVPKTVASLASPPTSPN